jgi:hypothetical protein
MEIAMLVLLCTTVAFVYQAFITHELWKIPTLGLGEKWLWIGMSWVLPVFGAGIVHVMLLDEGLLAPRDGVRFADRQGETDGG